jgi:hypothetical protein
MAPVGSDCQCALPLRALRKTSIAMLLSLYFFFRPLSRSFLPRGIRFTGSVWMGAALLIEAIPVPFGGIFEDVFADAE